MQAKVIDGKYIKTYKRVDTDTWDKLTESKRSIVTFDGEWDLAELVRIEYFNQT